MGVLNSIQNDNKWIFTFFFRQIQNIFYVAIIEWWHHCNHALMIFTRHTLQFCFFHFCNYHARFFCLGYNFFDGTMLLSALHKYFIDISIRFQQFQNRISTIYNVIILIFFVFFAHLFLLFLFINLLYQKFRTDARSVPTKLFNFHILIINLNNLLIRHALLGKHITSILAQPNTVTIAHHAKFYNIFHNFKFKFRRFQPKNVSRFHSR